MKRIQYILIILFILIYQNGFTQTHKYDLKINYADTANDESVRIVNSYENYDGDSLAILDQLKNVINDLRVEGFIASSIDSVLYDSSQILVKLYIGQQYKINKLEINGIDLDNEKIRGLKKAQLKNITYEFTDLQDIKHQIVTYCENNGYPFASISTDQLFVDNLQVALKLNVEKGNYFTIDTIVLKGDATIKPHYIHRYIDIKPGDSFSQDKINRIENRIKDLSFLELIKPSELEFQKNKADLYVYLKNKKANQFNGIIGFIPDSEKSDKLVVTGDLQLFLVNSFSRGEEIGLRWEKLESETQKLDVKFQYPYFFKLPFGLDMNFNLYKQDSLFLNVNYSAGLRWYVSPLNHYKAYYRYKNSSMIGEVVNSINFADVSSSVFGASANYKTLDYAINPRIGIELSVFGGAGTKNIKEYKSQTDTLNTSRTNEFTEFEAGINFDSYFPVYGNFVIHFGHITKYMGQFDEDGNHPVFYENEMYYFGGARSLRGFDEHAFAASVYSLQNIELRYLFEQNSAFYLFWNGAYYYKPMPEKTTEDFPWGIGIGLNFDTKAGIFSISYAVGKQFDNPIEIQAAKIHFGYISRF
ncbi:MAG: POTRA domain-containing protein [Bacteroidales bacterium]